MEPIGVVLADDHAVLREGLAALIDGQSDMVVLAHASNGQEAVQACAEAEPDVAVVDLSMPKLGGIEAIGAIHKKSPSTRVVVLTMHDNSRYLQSALAAGAAGYVVKELASREILDAIRAVHEGQMFIRVSLANNPPGALLSTPKQLRGATRGALSRREREVLCLIAQGHTHREIAETLGVGKKSIDSYRARLQQKLGMSRRSELVRYALETGLLTADAFAETSPDRS